MSSLMFDRDDDSQSDEPCDTWQDLKDSLFAQISQIDSAGSFATSGTVEELVIPGISIDSQNPIGFPLSVDDARSVIGASHRAPFGNGTKTIIDESVRKTWQIDANRIHFANKSWPSWLDRITDTVVRDLGIAGGSKNVRAEPHKMLIYEESAMFKPHRDTEKIPGMVGTLVICFPSQHTGGDVCLQHGSKSKRFATDKSSAFSITFMAWYADVYHEIEPVQSGYRWVMTYNLINTSGRPGWSADVLEARVQDFVHTFQQWKDQQDRPPFLIFPFAHQYTDQGLKLELLKGEDFYRASHVAQSCAEQGAIQVLLANMEMCVTDHQDEDYEDDTVLKLTRVVDLAGFKISIQDSLCIPDTVLLGGDRYDDRDPDVQRGGGHMGNEHAEIEQLYKDSVMVMVPHQSFQSFLIGDTATHKEFESLMAMLRIRAGREEASSKTILRQICHDTIKGTFKHIRERDFDLGSVAVTATVLRDPVLFAEAVEETELAFGPDSYVALGEVCNQQTQFDGQYDVVQALTKSGTLHQTFHNLQCFRTGLLRGTSDPSDVNQTKIRLDDILFASLKGVHSASSDDARCLIDIVIGCEETTLRQYVLYQGVREFVYRFSGEVQFSIPCTIEILLHLASSTGPLPQLSSLIDLLIEPTVSRFDLPTYASYIESRGHQLTALDASAKPIASLYNRVRTLDLSLATILLEKIRAQAPNLVEPHCQFFLLELISDLLCILDLSASSTQACVYSLLTTYIGKNVGDKPRRPRNWSRVDEVYQCAKNCQLCFGFNKFLRDSKESTHRISQAQLEHLHSHLEYLEVESSITTDEIVVKKTKKCLQRKHQDWERRAAYAVEEIRKLPTERLRACLSHQYEDVLALKTVNIVDSPAKRITTVRGRHHYLTRSNVPQKRSMIELR